MAWPTSPVAGMSTATGTPASPKVSNTFGSLKAMFKPQYPQKKCKTCKKMFTPKVP